jgi:hypothetical protein
MGIINAPVLHCPTFAGKGTSLACRKDVPCMRHRKIFLTCISCTSTFYT